MWQPGGPKWVQEFPEGSVLGTVPSHGFIRQELRELQSSNDYQMRQESGRTITSRVYRENSLQRPARKEVERPAYGALSLLRSSV